MPWSLKKKENSKHYIGSVTHLSLGLAVWGQILWRFRGLLKPKAFSLKMSVRIWGTGSTAWYTGVVPQKRKREAFLPTLPLAAVKLWHHEGMTVPATANNSRGNRRCYRRSLRNSGRWLHLWNALWELLETFQRSLLGSWGLECVHGEKSWENLGFVIYVR